MPDTPYPSTGANGTVSDDSKVLDELAVQLHDKTCQCRGKDHWRGPVDMDTARIALEVFRSAGWCAPREVPPWMKPYGLTADDKPWQQLYYLDRNAAEGQSTEEEQ